MLRSYYCILPTKLQLHIQTIDGNTEAVKLALDRGLDIYINVKDDDGRTPLHYGARHGRMEIVKLLLERGADINVKDDVYGHTALHLAAQGHTKTVKLLLDKGVADINVKNKFGYTVLHIAAEYGNTEIVKLLLDRGIDMHAKNNDGKLAIYYAKQQKQTKIVELLLRREKQRQIVEFRLKHPQQTCSFLILAGTTDPPKSINAESELDNNNDDDKNDDGKANGNYLPQVIKNIQIVEHDLIKNIDHNSNHCFKYELFNCYRNMRATKKEALHQIDGVFQDAIKYETYFGYRNNRVGIYYTGHGSNGNWCFIDGVITLKDIFDIISKYEKCYVSYLRFEICIYSQCCKSGNWCKELSNYAEYCGEHYVDIDIYASSHPDNVSFGNEDGSYWTKYYWENMKDVADKVNGSMATVHGGKYRMSLANKNKYWLRF